MMDPVDRWIGEQKDIEEQSARMQRLAEILPDSQDDEAWGHLKRLLDSAAKGEDPSYDIR